MPKYLIYLPEDTSPSEIFNSRKEALEYINQDLYLTDPDELEGIIIYEISGGWEYEIPTGDPWKEITLK